MKPFKILFFSPLILVMVTGCATIFLGPQQRVSINSEPTGAEVYVNGQKANKQTPCDVVVTRRVSPTTNNQRNEQVYVLKKDNYSDAEYHDKSTFHWLAGIDFFCYIVPGVIDVAAGSTRKYQDDIFVKMSKNETVYEKQIVYVPTGSGKAEYVFEKLSDVDQNIPVNPTQNPNRFALIIGNEDYSSHQTEMGSEVNVEFARNDASAVKEYCIKTMGIPETNIIFLLDATTGQMNQAISKANKIIKNTQGKAIFVAYYAGHGLPDEVSKDAFLMPVDVSGKNASEGIALKTLYEKLTEFPSERLTVFIDACFSGGARNQGLLAARGVKINPKMEADAAVKGNLVVFSASSGEQSSLPLTSQKHGLFTYYLLKKLKESSGNVSYEELSNYITENVSLQSVLINDKEQNPKVNVSNGSQGSWKAWKIK